jgi:hypothetical protein
MSDQDKREIDEFSGVETTGHEWDGIKELNNPLPRWWLWTFYATIVWAIGYTIAYPAWPLVNSATQGVLGYSSRAELHQEIDRVQTGARGAQRGARDHGPERHSGRRRIAQFRHRRRRGRLPGQLLAVPRHRRPGRGGLPQPQ